MNPPPDLRQRAIALIEQLPADKLTAITQLLEILVVSAPGNPEESALLNIIQQQLPATQYARLIELRDRCEWGELSEAEHQELIRYEDWLEQRNSDRLAALMKLASLRNVDLISLNRQLKTEAETLHAS
jgi:hypothetical protein